VVRQKKKPAARQPFQADRFDAVNRARERQTNETKGALGVGNRGHAFMIYNPASDYCNRQIP
jgi:hypothetical protein